MIERIAEAVAVHLGLRNWTWHMILTPMGYDLVSSKCILQIEAGGRQSKFFMKISNSPRLNSYLKREADSILALTGFGVSRIPEVVLQGSFGGRVFVVQKFIEGDRIHGSRQWLEQVFNDTKDWLSELYGKAGHSEIAAEDLMKRVDGYVNVSKEYFDTADSVAIMEGRRPSGPIPTTWIHGDFWHGNMVKDHAGRIWMTDFSMAAGDEPPVDIFDLILDYEPDYLMSARTLAPYISGFVTGDVDPMFLALYNLNRKIALKLKARKALYDEMLLIDFNRALATIEEAGVLPELTTALGGVRV